MKMGMHMNSFAKLTLLAAAALPLLASTTADAKPVQPTQDGSVRDRRTQESPPPVVGVSSSPDRPRRYRRRPGPRFMMPLKIDIGAPGANTCRGCCAGMELRAGIHWASLSPKPTNFDVGVGVFGALLAGPRRRPR